MTLNGQPEGGDVIIGIDLDNTLFSDFAISKAAKELGYPHRNTDHMSWNLVGFPEDLRARVRELWVDDEYMGSLPPVEGNAKILREWKDAGHEVNIVTARGERLRESTIEMVEEHYKGLVDYITMVRPDEDKVPVLKKIGVDVWIDDSPDQVRKTVAAGIPTILVTNPHTKYNWEVRDTFFNVPRFESVAQIPKNFIEGIVFH